MLTTIWLQLPYAACLARFPHCPHHLFPSVAPSIHAELLDFIAWFLFPLIFSKNYHLLQSDSGFGSTFWNWTPNLVFIFTVQDGISSSLCCGFVHRRWPACKTIHSSALFCISHFFLAACSCSHPDTRALSLVPFSSHCAHASYGGKIPIMMRAWQEVDEVAVLAGGMHRSLVLVMDRDVAGHHIAKVSQLPLQGFNNI